MVTTRDRMIILILGTGHGLVHPDAVYSTTRAGEGTVLLPDDQLVQGTVQGVKSGQIQINIGELQPVFLSVDAASKKGMPSLQPGDKLTIVVSGENEFIDFHMADQPGWDRVVKGHLAQPLMGDQRWALVQTAQGRLEPYEVAQGNDARQKVLQLPVGVPALFLLHKANTIIDATFGDERALMETLAKWSKDRQRIIHQ